MKSKLKFAVLILGFSLNSNATVERCVSLISYDKASDALSYYIGMGPTGATPNEITASNESIKKELIRISEETENRSYCITLEENSSAERVLSIRAGDQPASVAIETPEERRQRADELTNEKNFNFCTGKLILKKKGDYDQFVESYCTAIQARFELQLKQRSLIHQGVFANDPKLAEVNKSLQENESSFELPTGPGDI